MKNSLIFLVLFAGCTVLCMYCATRPEPIVEAAIPAGLLAVLSAVLIGACLVIEQIQKSK